MQSHLLKDIRNTVSDRRCRRQRKIDDTKWNTHTFGSLSGHELSHTSDLKCRLLDLLCQMSEVCTMLRLQCFSHNTRAADADIDDLICLGHAVECTRHKRIVIRCITEYHQLGTPNAVTVCCARCSLMYDISHQTNGIHIQAGLGGTKVYGAAYKICHCQCIRDGTDQQLVAHGHSLGHQSAVSSDEVDPQCLGRTIQCLGDRHVILRSLAGCRTDQRDRSDRYTLVDDRDSIFPLNILSGLHQILGHRGDTVVNLFI